MKTLSEIKTAYGTLVPSFTAGSAGDNALVTSSIVDREDFYSLSVCLGWSATLATSAYPLTALITVEDSSDGSNFSNLLTWSGILASESGTGMQDIDVPILGAKKYIRAITRVDLTATSTDTASYFVAYVLGDSSRKPV